MAVTQAKDDSDTIKSEVILGHTVESSRFMACALQSCLRLGFISSLEAMFLDSYDYLWRFNSKAGSQVKGHRKV